MVFFFISATNQQRTRNERFVEQCTYPQFCRTVNIGRNYKSFSMESTERELDRVERHADEAKRKARNGFGMGLAGVITGGLALGSELLRGGWLNGGRGGNYHGGGMPENVNINTNGGGSGSPSTFDVYAHDCEGILNLTNELWGLKVNTMTQAKEAREIDIAEKFGLYKNQVDGDFGNYKATRDLYDITIDKLNNAAFGLYKNQRDGFDVLAHRLCDLEKKVAVDDAIRPYQNALIKAEIEKAYTAGINYTDRKTCRMITGQVVLPSTPAVTGYGSYCCPNANQAG